MILKGLNIDHYTTGRELGRGGEGTVYELQNDPSLVVKLYNEPLNKDKISKLQRMLAMRSPAIEAYAAWPVDLVLDDTAKIYGFVMKKLVGFVPMHMIFSPMDRKKMFPDKGYNFLVHVARNLATAFFKLHEAGLIVGDVNEGNILISANGMVAFIDCDSFQVKGDDKYFFCEVGVPRYTPRELLKKGSFENVVRTVNTDSFSLAILIFQLLFMGRHPYAGRNKTTTDIDEETAIRQNQFAYSLENKKKKLSPPINSLPIEHLPESLISLFHRAFEQDERPVPADWIKSLDAMLADMLVCNVSKLHSYPAQLQDCPWCYFKNKAGILFFLDNHHLHVSAVLNDIESFINGYKLEKIDRKKWNKNTASLNLVAAPIPAHFKSHKNKAIASLLIGVTICVMIALPLGINVFSAMVLLAGLGGHLFFSRKIKAELNNREIDYKTYRERLEYLCREYENLPELQTYNEGIVNWEKTKLEFRRLPQEMERRKKVMEETIYNRQLDDFLVRYDIEKQTIPNFGPAKKVNLINAGIKTAADIPRVLHTKITGMGQKNIQQLLDWRRQMEAEFVYIPDDKKIALGLHQVNGEIANLRTHLETTIRKEYQSLNFLRANIQNHGSQLEKQINDLSTKTYQAELDLVVFRKFAA